MIKVIIFSDIRIYCEGLSEVLSNIDTIQVVGAEGHLDDAIEKIKILKPDVILLDMTMSGSCQIAQNVMQNIAKARIVALAAPVDKDRVIRCAEVGITGYVAREAPMEDLVEALKRAKVGEYCYPPKIASFIFSQFHKVSAPVLRAKIESPEQTSLSRELTERERQIALLMAEGLSNKQIARELSIEVSTVKNHVHNILAKLRVRRRAQVAAMLHHSVDYRSGSIDLDRNNFITV